MAGKITILDEVALYCNDGIHRNDAIWAAAYTENSFLCVWGARDTRYNDRGSKLDISLATARSTFNTKLNEKLRKNYRRVEFSHPQYGNIPSFAFRLGDGENGHTYELTPENFAGAIDRLAQQLQADTISFGNAPKSRRLDDSSRIRQVQLRLAGEVLKRGFEGDTTAIRYLEEQSSRLDSLFNLQVVDTTARLAENDSGRGAASGLVLATNSIVTTGRVAIGDDF